MSMLVVTGVRSHPGPGVWRKCPSVHSGNLLLRIVTYHGFVLYHNTAHSYNHISQKKYLEYFNIFVAIQVRVQIQVNCKLLHFCPALFFS